MKLTKLTDTRGSVSKSCGEIIETISANADSKNGPTQSTSAKNSSTRVALTPRK